MSEEFFRLAIVTVIVAIDNALLAGLSLPAHAHPRRGQVFFIVAAALALSQVVLAIGVGKLLDNLTFRVLAIALLSWLAIRTLNQPWFRGVSPVLSIVGRVYVFTAVGNLDNMIWLGSALNHRYVWLVLCSLATVPLFAVIALFLSAQCDKHRWILAAGAGMMAWAAAALYMGTPWGGEEMLAPSWLVQTAFAVGVLAIGLFWRLLRYRSLG